MTARLVLITLSFLMVCCHAPQSINKSNKGLLGNQCMVVSAHELASEAGKQILSQGGNAFDAAVTVHFVLAVVYPQAGNIGGGGFAIFRESNGTSGSLDFREKAPLQATKNMYLNDDGNVIPGKSLMGHLAVGVPGSVDGLFTLHKKYGSLPWSQLLQPAVDLAENGHTINESLAKELNRFHDDFLEVNKRQTAYTKDGVWKKGDTLINTNLAKTLTAIQAQGRDGFYMGWVAQKLINESTNGHGLITMTDLNLYKSKWRKPLTGFYKKHQIITMAPPSAGGVTLLQMLQGSEQFDFQKSGHNTAATIHQMIEIERRAYADRATYLGDPDFVKIPLDSLLSRAYNSQKFSSINTSQATPSSSIKKGQVEVIESMETTHFSILDTQGNAVAITTTLNSYFGSKVIVEGAGFFLNNEMDDFSAQSGVPNQFGLISTEVNSIQPEKRMLSSMTPTIVEKDGQVKMIIGTPGGSTIITSVYQTILNIIDHNMTMQEAVNAPKFHSQWLPDKVYFEKEKFAKSLLDSLTKLGHQTQLRAAIGKLECILVYDDGTIEGAADVTRNESAAAGF
ncbi:gamma-glutamyltranspeptidase / glutathione hydrolase [Reichenbachiella faecimaris]|uniref:Glutathione hydrolase proenzyme n=1 Tax=Reichenbachiella faecimaris TaxID=692418 RepID=A0A1W2GMG4_REIFA|nr:gamma-glutamyltransferase [Reichenbachiella faecimaris]SMD37847.1 gamma-glutamyltranspeptidase / glutathione hydrolase [Reichenbachiella faecimaris]